MGRVLEDRPPTDKATEAKLVDAEWRVFRSHRESIGSVSMAVDNSCGTCYRRCRSHAKFSPAKSKPCRFQSTKAFSWRDIPSSVRVGEV